MRSSAADTATAALARIEQAERPEVWIHRVDPEQVLRSAGAVDSALAAGVQLPLAGRVLAVKDNIDVAGIPTTAGCPAYAYVPTRTAPAVRRLLDAGAILVGKTNLDQFATGLVGTRSPYGACRNAFDPAHVAGGSSSGSAVAVALGMADIGLGTDTAGSGRVPAAFNGVVGTKPTRGLVSTIGVVPACRSLDCVSLLTRSVAEGAEALAVVAGFDEHDPWSRPSPPEPSPRPWPTRMGLPLDRDLDALDAPAACCFRAAIERLGRAGAELVAVGIEPYLAAGELLYGGGFIAERYAAVGQFIRAHPDEVDPVVRELILDAGRIPAWRLAADLSRLRQLARRFASIWRQVDVLVLPTAPTLPTIEAVQSAPISVNALLGTYTQGCNLLDLCAISVPAGRSSDGLPFGISFLAPAFKDEFVANIARHHLHSC
jgi:allophanate hydrolase